jgi:hypothetical protein
LIHKTIVSCVYVRCTPRNDPRSTT